MLYDVAIVGGGIAGLSCAAILAHEGEKVVVFERRDRVGGRAESWEYKKGYTVDYGIHALRYGKKGEAIKTLKKIDRKIKLLSPKGVYFYEDDKVYGTLRGGLKLFKISSIRPLISLIGLKEKNIEQLLDVSVSKWLGEKNDEVKKIFKMLSSLLIITPDIEKASMGELARTIINMKKAREGAAYPQGGWKTIIDIFKEEILNNGGEIKLNEEVKGVKAGKDIKIVGKSEVKSKSSVICVRHQKIFDIVDENSFSKEYAEYCKNIEPTSGISIDIGVDTVISEINGLVVSREIPMMGWVTSNIDESVAPDGEQLITFYFPMSYDDLKKNGENMKKIARETIFKIFPEIKEHIKWERILKLEVVDGSALTVEQHYKKRPPITSPIENLYFASDTCGVPGGGGDIAFRSARETAEMILNEQKVQRSDI